MSQLAVDGFRAEREAILTVAKGLTAERVGAAVRRARAGRSAT